MMFTEENQEGLKELIEEWRNHTGCTEYKVGIIVYHKKYISQSAIESLIEALVLLVQQGYKRFKIEGIKNEMQVLR